MSLARLALRLAAYEALNPYASIGTGPYPTIAGRLVYDSRIDPLQEGSDFASIEGKPLLIVYTEQDVATPYGSAKYPPDEQVVHLVIEAMIAVKGTVAVENGDGTTTTYGTVQAPISDRQHEGLLDLLEAQVRRVLDLRNRATSSLLLSIVAMEVHRIESVPQRADDRVTRMAARTLTFTVKVKKEAWSPIPSAAPPVGIAALPQPLLAIAQELDPASTGGMLCSKLAAQLAPLAPEPLAPPGSIVVVQTPSGSTDPFPESFFSSVCLNP